MSLIKLPIGRIDLGHVGIFRALAEAAGLPQEAEDNVLSLLQAKDVPGLAEACVDVPSPYREALQRLPQLYGGAEVLDRAAAELPALPEIAAALESLRHLLAGAPELLNVPSDRPRPASRVGAGGQETLLLPLATEQALRRMAQEQQA